MRLELDRLAVDDEHRLEHAEGRIGRRGARPRVGREAPKAGHRAEPTLAASMRLEPIPSLEAARAAWESLEPATGSVFSTWAWADAWWRVYGRGRRLALHAVHDGDRLAALLPVYRADRGPVPVLRLIGHGAGDELGPVCAPEDAELAAGALDALARTRLPAHGLLLVDRIRGDTPVAARLRGDVVRVESTPIVDGGGRDGDGWLAGCSANFRQEVRRRTRRAEERGVRIRLSDDPDRLDEDVAELVRLHRARWGAEASGAFAPARVALHRDFARRAVERGWLRLWMAEADGQAVAALYSLRFGDGEWYYQAGRDPAWDRSSLGTVVLAAAIRDAFDAGIAVYRLGVGDEPYKERFATGDPELRTFVLGRARARRTAAGAAHALRRLPPVLRRPLAREVA